MSAPERLVSRATKAQALQPLLLNNLQCARLMGIGINRFYELRKLDPNFPKPVEIPGKSSKGARQLRFAEDVEAYVRSLAQRDRVGGDSDEA